MKGRLILTLLVCSVIVSGCSSSERTTNRNLGAFVGAGAGGLAGSQIGGGTGNIFAIAAGVVLGAVAGDAIGGYLDNADRARIDQATQLALNDLPDGDGAIWSNPKSGLSGQVTPVRTYQSADGRLCRDVRHEMVVVGKKKSERSTLCRGDNRDWRVERS